MRNSKRSRGIITPITLNDEYVQIGDYSAKLLIDPAMSTSIDKLTLGIRDADGRPLEFIYRRWGTKLNIDFKITPETPDGVVIIDVKMSGRTKEYREKFDFWVIK